MGESEAVEAGFAVPDSPAKDEGDNVEENGADCVALGPLEPMHARDHNVAGVHENLQHHHEELRHVIRGRNRREKRAPSQ